MSMLGALVLIALSVGLGFVTGWFLRNPPVSTAEYDATTRLTEQYKLTDDRDDATINVSMTMRKRWVPHVLGMLRKMEYLGNIGSSRWVCLYADGDGDYRPKFKVNGEAFADTYLETGKVEYGDTFWGQEAVEAEDETSLSARRGYLFDAG